MPNIKLVPRQDGEYDILIEYSKADVEFAWEFGKRKNKHTNSEGILKSISEYADGQVLYNAEIELLEKIYQYPQANISILSVKLGVTKSAVTQMSIKLLDKGLIEKFQDSKNKKEKYFRLTNEGKKARETYMAHHDQALNEMRAYLCSLNEND